MKKLLLALSLSSFLLTACGGSDPAKPDAAQADKSDKASKDKKDKKGKKGKVDPAVLAAAEAAKQAKKDAAELAQQQGGILVIGDSLSADEGLASDSGWTGLLRKRLSNSQPPLPVVNASVSGDTASGGASRITWQLGRFHPRLIVLALGSRDIASTTPVSMISAQLEAVIRTAQANRVPVVLVGVHAPSSAPPAYQSQVDAMYRALATQYKLPLVPDLVAPLTRASLSVPVDGLDRDASLAQAQPAILETVWPAIETAMKQSGIQVAISP